jgi:hypothetical protein
MELGIQTCVRRVSTVCVQAESLRGANPPSKESYRM